MKIILSLSIECPFYGELCNSDVIKRDGRRQRNEFQNWSLSTSYVLKEILTQVSSNSFWCFVLSKRRKDWEKLIKCYCGTSVLTLVSICGIGQEIHCEDVRGLIIHWTVKHKCR